MTAPAPPAGVVVAHELMRGERFTPLPGGVLTAGWTTTVDLPPDAQICAVGMKENMPVLWERHNVVDVETGSAWVDTPCRILVVADGHPHEGVRSSGYIGTILPAAASTGTAWHVFVAYGEPRYGEVPW